jgi:hypothetical protein
MPRTARRGGGGGLFPADVLGRCHRRLLSSMPPPERPCAPAYTTGGLVPCNFIHLRDGTEEMLDREGRKLNFVPGSGDPASSPAA